MRIKNGVNNLKGKLRYSGKTSPCMGIPINLLEPGILVEGRTLEKLPKNEIGFGDRDKK